MNPDLIGWIGNVGFIIGAILIARKHIIGFCFNFIGNASYIMIGILLHTSSLYAISFALAILNIYGIIYWKKNERNQNKRRV